MRQRGAWNLSAGQCASVPSRSASSHSSNSAPAAAIDDALPDPCETFRVGDVGKMADQRVADRSAELAGRQSAQQFTLRLNALLEPFLKALPMPLRLPLLDALRQCHHLPFLRLDFRIFPLHRRDCPLANPPAPVGSRQAAGRHRAAAATPRLPPRNTPVRRKKSSIHRHCKRADGR